MRRAFCLKTMIVVMFLFAASAYSAFSAASSLKGLFLVDGKWVSGTLYGDGILLNGDIATAKPPAALVLDGGGGIVSSDKPIVIHYRPISNKIAISAISSFLSDKEISFGSNGEISINSEVWLELAYMTCQVELFTRQVVRQAFKLMVIICFQMVGMS